MHGTGWTGWVLSILSVGKDLVLSVRYSEDGTLRLSSTEAGHVVSTDGGETGGSHWTR